MTALVPNTLLTKALTSHFVSQQEAGRAAGLRQAVQQLQQQLHSSRDVAQQSQQQLQEQVQQLQRNSSDKENNLVQLQQKCQATQIQLQVRRFLVLTVRVSTLTLSQAMTWALAVQAWLLRM